MHAHGVTNAHKKKEVVQASQRKTRLERGKRTFLFEMSFPERRDTEDCVAGRRTRRSGCLLACVLPVSSRKECWSLPSSSRCFGWMQPSSPPPCSSHAEGEEEGEDRRARNEEEEGEGRGRGREG